VSMKWLVYLPFVIQSAVIFFDEFYFHLRRGITSMGADRTPCRYFEYYYLFGLCRSRSFFYEGAHFFYHFGRVILSFGYQR